MEFLTILNLIIPFVMLAVGYALKKRPVTSMNRHCGYNTPAARKSQAHWDYAQHIGPDLFLKLGKISFAALLFLSAVMLLCKISVAAILSLGLTAGLLFLTAAFLRTEKQINRKFPAINRRTG